MKKEKKKDENIDKVFSSSTNFDSKQTFFKLVFTTKIELIKSTIKKNSKTKIEEIIQKLFVNAFKSTDIF